MPHHRLPTAVALAILALMGGHAQAQPAAADLAQTADAAALPATVARDNLWNLAARLPLPAGASRPQVMAALLRLNPEAFLQGNMHRLRVGVALRLPSAAEILAEPSGPAARLVEQHRLALQPGATGPMPLPVLPARAVPSDAKGPGPARSALPGVPAAAPPVGGASGAATATASAASADSAARARPSAAIEPVPASPAPTSSPAADRPAAPAASAVAAEPASAPAITAEPASAALPVPGPAPAADGSGWVRWLPYLLLVALGGGAWLLWQRRRRDREQQRFTDSVVSSFYDENGVRRPSRPKLIDVSQAGVETARTVETLRPAAELVRSGDSSLVVPDLDDGRHREAALKLEMARTSLEVGRSEAARLMLQAVQREGNAAQQLAAGELLGRLSPV